MIFYNLNDLQKNSILKILKINEYNDIIRFFNYYKKIVNLKIQSYLLINKLRSC